jgi:hypothetical protein
MNAQALAVDDDDDDEDIQINARSERKDALIAAVKNYHMARRGLNKDERLLAATEEDLLNMSRRFFEW